MTIVCLCPLGSGPINFIHSARADFVFDKAERRRKPSGFQVFVGAVRNKICLALRVLKDVSA